MRKLKHMVYGNVNDIYNNTAVFDSLACYIYHGWGNTFLLFLAFDESSGGAIFLWLLDLSESAWEAARGRGILTETENRGNSFDNAVEHHSLHSLPLWQN